jgi:hypothetical protein
MALDVISAIPYVIRTMSVQHRATSRAGTLYHVTLSPELSAIVEQRFKAMQEFGTGGNVLDVIRELIQIGLAADPDIGVRAAMRWQMFRMGREVLYKTFHEIAGELHKRFEREMPSNALLGEEKPDGNS